MIETAFVLGRFQTVHNGHACMLKQARELGVKHLYVGVASPQHPGTKKNPFDLEERIEMLTPVLDGLGISYSVHGITDINDPPNYAQHVLNCVEGMTDDTVIVSGNPYTLECFTNYDYSFATFTQKHPQKMCATQVREMIAHGDEAYKEMVPQSTVAFIEGYGKHRLTQLFSDTPNSCIDNMIIVDNKEIVLIKRSSDGDANKPFLGYWALPGGRVDPGEALYETALRETQEETGIVITPQDTKMIRTYTSDADPRGGYTTVFVTHLTKDRVQSLKPGTDAEDIRLFSLDAVPPLAFDHNLFVNDYRGKL